MVRFLEVGLKQNRKDFEGKKLQSQCKDFLNLDIDEIRVRKLYSFDLDIDDKKWEIVKKEIVDNVIEKEIETHKNDNPNYVLKIGFNPGVTDNEGRTAKSLTEDIFDQKFDETQKVYTSILYLFYDNNISKEDIKMIANEILANKLINDIKIFKRKKWIKKNSYEIPKIDAEDNIDIKNYDLNISDKELTELSEKRTLALTLKEMQTIKNYYNKKNIKNKRLKYGYPINPTDAELEMLAQTWSEHCKHKIFASKINYKEENKENEIIDSLYKTYIRNSTKEIQKDVDHIVKVFDDDSGVITFNEKNHICYKVETHNSPSALDPYGGAMTGIVGVNRDILGTGQGAVPHINVWGYCFGDPEYDKEIPKGLLHPKRIRDGVHKGVVDGGNQSGIPYGRGWELFDDRYMGKPLVYCGTVGILPKDLNGKDGSYKKAKVNDKVVMIGGRIGKDGIHGATFSSQELNEDSPVQAVQIGDPITQKKMTDFLIEARDKGLYNCITDNGAGGLSSSVGEMAEFTNGAYIDLSKAPLKYHGLQPWEILISEAQERMTLSVPSDKIDRFKELAKKRDVEVAVLGEYTDTGYFHAVYEDKMVCFLDMEFLHDGVPQMQLEAKWENPEEKIIPYETENLKKDILKISSTLNLASKEDKMRRYDHEVKGQTIIKPLIGKKQDIMNDVSVFGIDYKSYEGVVLSEGVNPFFSEIDTYHMTASIIDEAVRKAIVTGADPEHLAGLDNFCWPDPVYDKKNNPDGKYKLAQLVRSNKALYDYTKAYKAACISGKDSMKNDANIYGEKISIPPTLLFSLVGKIADYRNAITFDFKSPEDLIYILGTTRNELGQSEYYRMKDIDDGAVPRVDSKKANKLYKRYHSYIKENKIKSAHSPHKGGIAYSLLLQTMSSEIGAEINLDSIPTENKLNFTKVLFSESNSRIIVTIPSQDKKKFEKYFKGITFEMIGKTIKDKKILLKNKDKVKVNIDIEEVKKKYKERLYEK